MMKTLLALLAFTLTAAASEVLTCDPAPELDVNAFKFYVAPTNSGPFTLLATVSVPIGGKPWATNATTARMFYQVTAVNTSLLESDPSDTAFVPLAVTGLKITGNALSWNPSPAADLVTNYTVYASILSNAPKPWSVVANVNGTSVGNILSGMYYYIAANNLYGTGWPSVVISKPGKPTGPKVAVP